MTVIYRISGFNKYIIIDKILYRIPYKTKSVSNIWQFRNKRKINRTFKDGVEGYYLVKNGIRKFYSFKKLKHRLKKENYGI